MPTGATANDLLGQGLAFGQVKDIADESVRRGRLRHGRKWRPTPAPVAAPAPVPGADKYLKVFPVTGEYVYRDDFGQPRGQGPHQGNDVMADRGTPLVAVDDGVVNRLTRTELGLGGIYVWLERADGVQYYYAHMNTIADGLVEGSNVAVGQVIGTVGNTGDARYGATHLHFEIRPDGRTPINPCTHLQGSTRPPAPPRSANVAQSTPLVI